MDKKPPSLSELVARLKKLDKYICPQRYNYADFVAAGEKHFAYDPVTQPPRLSESVARLEKQERCIFPGMKYDDIVAAGKINFAHNPVTKSTVFIPKSIEPSEYTRMLKSKL